MLVLVLTSCATEESSSDALTILVTTSVLGDIIEEAFGEGAEVAVLMPRGADPHEFEPSARQVAAVTEAELVIGFGLGLESGLDDALSNANRIIWIGPAVNPLLLDGDQEHSDEEEDHGLDPHVWLDVSRMVTAVDAVAERLSELDAATDWAALAAGYRSELIALDEWVLDQVSSIPPQDRVLVTGHDAFGYFADRYGFEVLATILPGATTMLEPSASGFAELIAVLEGAETRAIFTDRGESQALAEQLASELGSGVEVVPLFTGTLDDPGTEAGTYLGLMRSNTEDIVEALR